MPNINPELEAIKTAVYGEEVRDAIYNALVSINNKLDELGDGAVHFDVDQSLDLTDNQKAVARTNIDALSNDKFLEDKTYRISGILRIDYEENPSITASSNFLTITFDNISRIVASDRDGSEFLGNIQYDAETGQAVYNLTNANHVLVLDKNAQLVEVKLWDNVTSNDILLWYLDSFEISGHSPIPNYRSLLYFILVGSVMYPIGSIYLTINNINPGSIFGGTWSAFGSGTVDNKNYYMWERTA